MVCLDLAIGSIYLHFIIYLHFVILLCLIFNYRLELYFIMNFDILIKFLWTRVGFRLFICSSFVVCLWTHPRSFLWRISQSYRLKRLKFSLTRSFLLPKTFFWGGFSIRIIHSRQKIWLSLCWTKKHFFRFAFTNLFIWRSKFKELIILWLFVLIIILIGWLCPWPFP